MNFRIRRLALPLGLLFAAGVANAENPLLASNDGAIAHSATSLKANRLVTDQAELERLNLKGWDHLYKLLRASGEDPKLVAQVLSDPRMPRRETLYFNLEPRESASIYRGHNTKRNRQNAIEFFNTHREEFYSAARTFGIPPAVILALIQVETHCGQVTGKNRVFHRLARLATAADPENVRENFEQKKRLKGVTLLKVRARADVLENTFLPHVAATLRLARSLGIHPLDIQGSGAGAIGIPQFLPGNVTTFGVDADRNGRIDLYNPADAIHSVARFLKEHGWKNGRALAPATQRQVIRHYNRSEPYVSTVLAMAAALEKMNHPLASASVSLPKLAKTKSGSPTVSSRSPRRD